MKKISIFLYFLVSFAYAQQGVSSDWTPDTEDIYKPELKITLKIKQQEFYVNQPIMVDVYIKNISNLENSITLNLKKNLIDNLRFNLVNEKNAKTAPSVNYLTSLEKQEKEKKNEYLYDFNRNLNTKKIDLAYNDTFVTRVDLNDFFDMNEGNSYFLSGDFVLNLSVNDQQKIKINYPLNQISFAIQGQYQDNRKVKYKSSINVNKKNNFYSSKTPPYDVVELFLDSQQKKDWKTHLEVLSLIDYLDNSYSNTTIYERFISTGHDEKDFVLNDFKDMLINSYDYRIESFDIVSSFIEKDIANVRVNVTILKNIKKWGKTLSPINKQVVEGWNEIPGTEEKDKIAFIFQLKKIDGFWKIIKKDAIASSLKKLSNSQIEEKPLKFNTREIIYFDVGSYEIKSKYYQNLENVADYIKLNPNYKIVLNGFADSTGESNKNLLLSKKRALRTKQYLMDKLGVTSDRIRIKWFGDEKPTSINRFLNRRVEIAITQE